MDFVCGNGSNRWTLDKIQNKVCISVMFKNLCASPSERERLFGMYPNENLRIVLLNLVHQSYVLHLHIYEYLQSIRIWSLAVPADSYKAKVEATMKCLRTWWVSSNHVFKIGSNAKRCSEFEDSENTVFVVFWKWRQVQSNAIVSKPLKQATGDINRSQNQ